MFSAGTLPFMTVDFKTRGSSSERDPCRGGGGLLRMIISTRDWQWVCAAAILWSFVRISCQACDGNTTNLLGEEGKKILIKNVIIKAFSPFTVILNATGVFLVCFPSAVRMNKRWSLCVARVSRMIFSVIGFVVCLLFIKYSAKN